MILIVCVDENNGMLFNNRRQSRDKILLSHIMEIVKDENLWITSFSQDMFDIVENKNILIDNECINKASKNEYCFIENIDVNAIIEKVDKIILYNWNRKYPADKYFDVSLEDWNLISQNQFIGSSHENITEKIFIRRDV